MCGCRDCTSSSGNSIKGRGPTPAEEEAEEEEVEEEEEAMEANCSDVGLSSGDSG